MKKSFDPKSLLGLMLTVLVICACFAVYAEKSNKGSASVYAAEKETVIVMTAGSSVITVNGEEKDLGPDGGAPLIKEGRTLVPIRTIVEAVGGDINWNGDRQQADISQGGNSISLVIGSVDATVNGEVASLDVPPEIINGRTMVPLRFVSENLGFDVDWNSDTKEITLKTSEAAKSAAAPDEPQALADGSTVYFTSDISSEGLVNIYKRLNFVPEGNVAVKLSTGEPPNSNYLRPELIKELVQSVDGTIVECNTAYGGSRSSTAMHRQVISDHGFDEIAEVDIMDEEGNMEIPVNAQGSTIQTNTVGSHLERYNSLICLSHFKGHAIAGYGGAIKNMSIGMASRTGKNLIHTAGRDRNNWFGGDQDEFLESMGDANYSVVDYFDGRVVYINVMNRLSVDCDCDGNPAEPDMHDIGILASYDPVALDQACIDLIYEQKDGDGASLVNRIESRNGLHTLEHAEAIGLGSREYNIVNIDSEEETETETETETAAEKSTEEPVSGIVGDIDRNQKLTANDAAALLLYVMTNTPSDNYETAVSIADVDNDGERTSDDVALIMLKVLDPSVVFPREQQ